MRARFNETAFEFQIRTGKPSSQIFARVPNVFYIIWILTYIHTNFYADNPTHKQVGCFLLIFHRS